MAWYCKGDELRQDLDEKYNELKDFFQSIGQDLNSIIKKIGKKDSNGFEKSLKGEIKKINQSISELYDKYTTFEKNQNELLDKVQGLQTMCYNWASKLEESQFEFIGKMEKQLDSIVKMSMNASQSICNQESAFEKKVTLKFQELTAMQEQLKSAISTTEQLAKMQKVKISKYSFWERLLFVFGRKVK